MEMGRDAALDRDAVDALEEVDVEEGAPVFAVGDALEPGVLLQPHRLADALVLHPAQLFGLYLAILAPLPRRQQPLGAQQAAHMIGPVGWVGAVGHDDVFRNL